MARSFLRYWIPPNCNAGAPSRSFRRPVDHGIAFRDCVYPLEFWICSFSPINHLSGFDDRFQRMRSGHKQLLATVLWTVFGVLLVRIPLRNCNSVDWVWFTLQTLSTTGYGDSSWPKELRPVAIVLMIMAVPIWASWIDLFWRMRKTRYFGRFIMLGMGANIVVGTALGMVASRSWDIVEGIWLAVQT